MGDQTAYRVKVVNQIGRWLLRPLGRLLYRILARPEVEGLENVPKEGAYLIAINHVSIFEPPFVIPFWPVPPEPLGAVEVWREPDKALLAKFYGGIPIDRDNYDRQALDRVVVAIRGGARVLIAPEGRLSRVPGLRRAKLGVAYLAERTNATIVPVGVSGATQNFLARALRGQKPAIRMKIGKPFVLPPISTQEGSRKEAYQRNADLVMARIAALLPSEYQGYYADYPADD
ncbi:MAG: 1-acyl-sn-glycerol-3-phosphate acyltransferase [Chloroflexi bacterium]|nr:1-acyl-sn-glycerol-3-phosphate acyltransferase [Chloroflexota bacterium]